jgi:hypothetical protein
LVGHDPGRLAAPFGPSHDGFNAALYMTGGRAIVEQGLVASRMGAVSRTVAGDVVVYAHHPPLAYLTEAASLWIARSPEIAARLPPLIASLAVLALLVLLMTGCGLRQEAVGLGLLVAFATPMFVMFGTVIEPHALGLLLMTALALLWQRGRIGGEASGWAFAALAGLAALTSWEAALFAGSMGVVLSTVERRRWAGGFTLAGTAAGAGLVGLWILWAYQGHAGEFVQRALLRTGVAAGSRVSLAQVVQRQKQYLTDLFPVGRWLVIPAAALGVLDKRTRIPVAVSLGTVLGYALLFRKGAADHGYWLYCVLLPLALSAGAAADAVARWLERHAPWSRAAAMTLGAGLVATLGLALTRPSNEQRQRDYVAEIGAAVRVVRWPPTQRYAYHAFGDMGPTDLLPWVLFYSRRQPFGVTGPQDVPRGEIMLRLVDRRLVSVLGERATRP